MTDTSPTRFHRRTIAALRAAALLIGCAILFTWAWNAVAVDLFQLPAARFKHALGLEAGIVGLALIAGWVARLLRRRVPLAAPSRAA